MILFQEKPFDVIKEDKEKIRKKRHQLHVMMSAYCTINCDANNTPEKDIQHGGDGE
jgi:hypothetical protein